MKKNDVLHCWKDISAYLDRDVRTCYRWEAEFGLPVHRIDENSSRSKVFAYTAEIDEWLKERANNGKDETISPKRKINRIILGLAVGSVLLAAVLAWINFIAPVPRVSLSEPTLAILPFKSLGTSEYDEYFFEGITNDITSGLIRLNKIKVIPAVDNDRIDNRKLGADYIVVGELRKDKDKIWINISLIRTKDRKNIWADEYGCDQTEIFSVKQDICKKIHEKIGFEVDEALLSQSIGGTTRDYMAYDTYLKGNFILDRIAGENDDPWKLYHQGKYYLGRWTPESNELAISLFRQAIAIDNSYALPYVGLAQCYANNVNFNWDTDIEWLNSAESYLEKAQKISPDLPEYYSTLLEIYLLRGDCLSQSTHKEVFELAENALERNPNHPELNSILGYTYLAKYGETGDEADFEKAYIYKERSFLLNPSGSGNIKFAELLMLKKEFNKAIEVCHIIERSEPSLFSQFMLGEVYYFLGDLDKSEEIFLRFDMPFSFKIHSMYYLAMIEAQRGEREKALNMVREIEIMKPEEYRDLPFQFEMASIYFGIGDKESGYRYLESLFNDSRAVEDRFLYSKYTEIDKNFNYYRNEERFQNLFQGDL